MLDHIRLPYISLHEVGDGPCPVLSTYQVYTPGCPRHRQKKGHIAAVPAEHSEDAAARSNQNHPYDYNDDNP